jgi:hypothetical protein
MGLWRKKGAWDEEVFKTSFTSFWLKDIFLQSFLLVILSSESEDQDLKKGSSKKLSTKPDRTRPLWEEKVVFSFQGGRVVLSYIERR